MKYSNWSQIFANDPNSDSYYKNAVDVSNLTINTIPAEKCIENIKKEPNLMYLSVEPITKAVQIIHHLTAIRGNIAMPETALVAISGFFSSPLAVCLNPKIFNVTKEFEVPSWANITGLVNSANVATTTTNTRNIKMESCCMITLLPFLAKTVIASISMTPAKLIVKFIATIKVFDTKHAADASFSSSIDCLQKNPILSMGSLPR